MHLRQPGFTDGACKPFLNTKKEEKNLKKPELDKACFQQDIADGDFKDLPRRTVADKVLRNKTFNTAKISKYDGC